MRSVSAFSSFFRIPQAVNVFAGRNRRNTAVRTRCHKLSYGFCSAIPRCKNLRSGSLAVLARTDKTALIKLHKLRKHTQQIFMVLGIVKASHMSDHITFFYAKFPADFFAYQKLPFLTRFAIFNNDSGKLAFPDEARNGAVQNRLNVCAGSKSVRNMFFGTKFAAAVNQINLAANL